MAAYYNEIDKHAAAWLRELISAGHIPAGDVDERSIENVPTNELKPYDQHHFFAGIGGWAIALRMAGWPDNKPVLTGSCPCQSFSDAGKGKGFDDKRHLWPAMFWHIQQLKPSVIFGEQVASKIALGWWDLVASDLEGAGYAAAAFDIPAASVGAFHRRQRLFWVGHANGNGARGDSKSKFEQKGAAKRSREGDRSLSNSADFSGSEPMANTEHHGFGRQGSPKTQPGKNRTNNGTSFRDGSAGRNTDRMVDATCPERRAESVNRDDYLRETPQRGESSSRLTECGQTSELANAASIQRQRERGARARRGRSPDGSGVEHSNSERFKEQRLSIADEPEQSSPQYSGRPWRGIEWHNCIDGKQRAVKPGIRLLANGVSGRVPLVRGYGNAIVPQVAAEFIKAYLDLN